MPDSYVMENLRRRVIDESEPLSGLLRTCLLLGAQTGSDALRGWAAAELHGYNPQDDVPKYRQLQLGLVVDGWIGAMPRTGYPVEFWCLQAENQEHLLRMPFQQSVDELEQMASSIGSLVYLHDGLLYAAKRAQGLPFTRIEKAYSQFSAAAVAGILGRIRTTLVEMVADMTRDIPFDALPTQNQVDSAVQVNVHGSQDQYAVHLGTNSGVIGLGAGSSQTQHVVNHNHDLANLLAQLRTAAAEIADDADRADAEHAVDDFAEAAEQEDAEPAVVRSRWRAVGRIGAQVGGKFAEAFSSELATTAVDALTSAV